MTENRHHLHGHALEMSSSRADVSKWFSAWWVVPLLVAVVFSSRYEAISLASDLNPDESQMMAEVMRLGVDPVPWRGNDGTTIGPLDTWFLYIAHAAGMPLDYRWVHGLAAAMLATMCVLVYATLRQVAGRGTAAAGGAAAATTIALAQSSHFAHFTSELVPTVLGGLVLLCLAARAVHPRHGLLLDGLAGLLIGTLPWTKFQSVLGASALWLWIAWSILRVEADERGTERSKKWQRVMLFAGATLLPTSVILGVVIAGGAWTDFWMSYVIANVGYVRESNVIRVAGRAFHLLHPPHSLQLVGVLGLGISWLLLGRPGWRSATGPLRRCLSATGLFAAATTLAVALPPYPFLHHDVLLILPLSLLAGCILGTWLTAGRAVRSGRFAGAVFAIFMFGMPLTTVMAAVRDSRAIQARRAEVDSTPARRIARRILAVAPDARRMVVWGWMPGLYVETGIEPGTRHSVGHFLIDPSPARPHLRASFLADVRREEPEVIVDAVAALCCCWGWDSTHRLGSFPELAGYVERNYVLAVEENLGDKDDPVRIYVSHRYLLATGREPSSADMRAQRNGSRHEAHP